MTDTTELPIASMSDNEDRPQGLWPIGTARLVRDAIETCRLGGQIGLVAGASGVGKTTAARAAVAEAQADGANAHYVMMTRAAEGLQPGLLRIATAIDAFVHYNMGAGELFDAVVSRVAMRWRRHGVLVLDEAQFMSDDLLDTLRSVVDELDGRGSPMGLVLIGTRDLAERIKGRTARKALRFEPLRGRLGVAVELNGLEATDFALVTAQLGITGPQATALLEKIGKGRGGLHNVRRVTEMAARLAGQGKALSLAHIRTAAEVAGVA